MAPVRLQKIRTITSYAGHARFLAECTDTPAGWIADDVRQDHGIRSPYVFSPDWTVYTWTMPATGTAQPVVIFETSHKRYEVFRVHGPVNPIETRLAQ